MILKTAMKIFLSIIGFVVLAVFLFVLLEEIAHRRPRVTATASGNGQKLKVNLKYGRVNSLRHIAVWSEESREILWFCKVDGPYPDQLEYGEVQPEWTQTYPESGGPQSLIPGKTYCLYVKFQYNYWLAPTQGTSFFRVSLSDSGEIETTTPCAPPPDFHIPQKFIVTFME